MAVETPLLSAKEYHAAKEAVLQHKARPRGANEKPQLPAYALRQRAAAADLNAALREHTVIIQTSGLRPGRENMLVDNVNVLRNLCEEALRSLEAEHATSEALWVSSMADLKSQLLAQAETIETLVANHAAELDQLQQHWETTQFEELEALTKAYDEKVLEIQELCEDKVRHVEAEINERVAAVRAKTKTWKVAFEAKLSAAATAKIDALKAQAEQQLNAVLTQLDKEMQTVSQALQASRQQNQSLQLQLATATARIAELGEGKTSESEKMAQLEEALAAETRAVAQHKHMYDTLLATYRAQQTQAVEDKARLIQHHALQQGLLESQLAQAKQDEIDKLHERVRHAVAMKVAIIERLKEQLAEEKSRAKHAEDTLGQIHSDLQSCGSGGRQFEAFPIDV
ncbi:hypothetical protein ACHHYP_14066 [Achlya hypogyna]|uniref:Uncharacterized protein n=1 Tax=Achlya hypogyna TaxID=1202772 RepID=A0A1V9YE52_ACHHY|nr:hypothetical protein ACHHYP_14066 [Achlya hypogyna]